MWCLKIVEDSDYILPSLAETREECEKLCQENMPANFGWGIINGSYEIVEVKVILMEHGGISE